ncbi:MAG: methyltransferase domain-containing protein [Methanomicrobiales archaeon]|nr:methyltransferase domain-containing protein [Methanomicrobiales archaeon]MDD1660304.1 methyltransferase domain-containing protein [Methanomicrobiales archaeon]
MAGVFDRGYSSAYDLLYRNKDYDAECQLLRRIFLLYGHGETRSVLDLGCGTGSHALRLARMGYRVTGVDLSPHMLSLAGEKARAQGLSLPLIPGDIRTIRVEGTFDAAVMMFAVLGYQTGDDDVRAALGNARRHLRKGGLFVADIWYGPAVLAQRPGERTLEMPAPGGKILRESSGRLDEKEHLCHVHFRLQEVHAGRQASVTEEEHRMRYFFPRELEDFLSRAGFALLRLGAFPELDRDPDETTWNAICVARAV